MHAEIIQENNLTHTK